MFFESTAIVASQLDVRSDEELEKEPPTLLDSVKVRREELLESGSGGRPSGGLKPMVSTSSQCKSDHSPKDISKQQPRRCASKSA